MGIAYSMVPSGKRGLKDTVKIALSCYFVLLLMLTHNRTQVWRDGFTLWSDVVSQRDEKFTTATNYASANADTSDIEREIAYFNVALAYSNRGIVRGQMSDYQGAIVDFNEALQLKPNYYAAFYNRGITRGILGDNHGEIRDYTSAIGFRPELGPAYFLRGMARVNLNQNEAGCSDLTRAHELGIAAAASEIQKHCKN